MNEQLIVKNFGPIKDATVDFKRVTVFIGPTGGGKSTLAKLAAVFRDVNYSFWEQRLRGTRQSILSDFGLKSYVQNNSKAMYYFAEGVKSFDFKDDEVFISLGSDMDDSIETNLATAEEIASSGSKLINEALSLFDSNPSKAEQLLKDAQKMLENVTELHNYNRNITKNISFKSSPVYILSERIFISSIEYSWAGLMKEDIGLSKLLLDFANRFSVSRKEISELNIELFNVKYFHQEGRDFIKIPNREEPLMLLETASGIQSVTPMMVLLENLSRNIEQAQSFIVEEPELNLYPIAQQGLLNWLVEKCTKGKNDLTITTHSPYILSSCNLLLEAYKVAQQRPELADEVAAIVPRECWLNPDEFAAYYVADGTVKSITDERTDLIGGNELDAVSGDISDNFRKLLRIKKQVA